MLPITFLGVKCIGNHLFAHSLVGGLTSMAKLLTELWTLILMKTPAGGVFKNNFALSIVINLF
jgi:hypothetical protein